MGEKEWMIRGISDWLNELLIMWGSDWANDCVIVWISEWVNKIFRMNKSIINQVNVLVTVKWVSESE